MKLVTFVTPSGPHVGALDGDAIVDLTATGDPSLASMLALIDAGDAGLDAARAALKARANTVPQAGTQLLAPLPQPRRMRDCLIFEQHVRQARARQGRPKDHPDNLDPAEIQVPESWYEFPVYYKGNPFSVIGPGADILWPDCAEVLDYELEMGIIIGKKGKNIPREQAYDHVFGYTVFNDVSARDVQRRDMAAGLGPAKGKDFDTGNVIGPCIVTRDEIPDPHALTMVATISGEEVCRNSSGTSHHKFPDVIAWASQDETIYPGEFLGSGTVGNGCGLENGRLLKPGDVVELEIEKIGVLRNRVVKPGA